MPGNRRTGDDLLGFVAPNPARTLKPPIQLFKRSFVAKRASPRTPADQRRRHVILVSFNTRTYGLYDRDAEEHSRMLTWGCGYRGRSPTHASSAVLARIENLGWSLGMYSWSGRCNASRWPVLTSTAPATELQLQTLIANVAVVGNYRWAI